MQDPTSDRLTANEAFALVGHETRVAVLRAMMDAAEDADDPSVAVSERRERVGTGESGPFDDHLGRLAGPFLDHGENGYRMRDTTLLAMGSGLAGTDTERGSAEPCPVCKEVVRSPVGW